LHYTRNHFKNFSENAKQTVEGTKICQFLWSISSNATGPKASEALIGRLVFDYNFG